MSTITQAGSYARYMSLVRTLSDGQKKVDTLTTQMNTNVKSVDLKGYGAETEKLLALRAELVKRKTYSDSIDTATTRLKTTDLVLTNLEKLTTDWQSNALMPTEPGKPLVSGQNDINPDALKVTLNTDTSKLTQNATYTVTSVPSKNGPNGTYDITITDGLGGKSTRTLNLNTVPPDDGKGYNFTMGGGPGEGAVLNITFDKLNAASTSSFDVSWPQANQTLERLNGAMRDIRQYLNEQVGDRYLFAGSRYTTQPVADLNLAKQVTKVTLDGSSVDKDDYFQLDIDGQTFSVVIGPNDPRTVTYVAQALTSQINSANPAIPLSVTTNNGIITMIGQQVGREFNIRSSVVNAAQVDNSVDPVSTLTPPTTTAPQMDRFTLRGDNVDIGDTFEFTVAVGNPADPYNAKYYTDHPGEPTDLPLYKEYTVKYTVTADDFSKGTTNVGAVADRLREQFGKMDPKPPVTLDVMGSGPGISITGNTPLDPNHPGLSTQFSTTAKVTNGSVRNTMTVKNLPPEPDPLTEATIVRNPDLPFYDSEYLSKRTNNKAWDKTAVTADDDYSIDYGVTSTDPSIQKLVSAFRMAKAAVSNPGKYKEYAEQALSMMADAKESLRSVHAKVASDLATLTTKKDEHTELSNSATDQVARIEGIDQTEVAARLRTSMNALEAAYTVAGQTQKMSLLNYLA
ncbi:flagellin-like hook-associated protein FlgL [Azospirillum fermentarium]|uniref:hypothetical protein n=1 Tax=Azospirillum fermentarium TaxID=1233114 RepID=UPI002226ABAA|nr:hypothetical protein [Azospirillum fermentarium]MCW2248167.1 flagellin-like hook-associated protein FlgL [Azospirillum fermentarium]